MIENEDFIISLCTKCSAGQEDFDGFGVLHCDECGYCAHPSSTGQPDGSFICDLCGAITTRAPGVTA